MPQGDNGMQASLAHEEIRTTERSPEDLTGVWAKTPAIFFDCFSLKVERFLLELHCFCLTSCRYPWTLISGSIFLRVAGMRQASYIWNVSSKQSCGHCNSLQARVKCNYFVNQQAIKPIEHNLVRKLIFVYKNPSFSIKFKICGNK